MHKCRIIDRLALSKGVVRVIEESEPEMGLSSPTHTQLRGEICPDCDNHSLFPEGGGWSCKSCGSSYCNMKGGETS